jgi:hypothetical protein
MWVISFEIRPFFLGFLGSCKILFQNIIKISIILRYLPALAQGRVEAKKAESETLWKKPHIT